MPEADVGGVIHAEFSGGVWKFSPEAYGAMIRKIARLENELEDANKKWKSVSETNDTLVYALGQRVRVSASKFYNMDTFDSAVRIVIDVDNNDFALGGVEVVRDAYQKGWQEVLTKFRDTRFDKRW
jgi:hypothetical protein